MQNKEDLRKFRRIPYLEEILVNNKILVKAIDISEGGLYVHTGRSFTPGNIVDVTLQLKDVTITVQANIQHNQSSVGMGLMFVGLSEKHKELIKQFIEAKSNQKAAVDARKMNVLLVEDNESARRIYKSKLILEGFRVNDVPDGIEAIKFLNANDVDLIVLDLLMEKMDGYKVLAMLKESPKWKDVPVIIFSSMGSQDVINKVIAAGADEFLSKMMSSPAKLADSVKSLLKKREG